MQRHLKLGCVSLGGGLLGSDLAINYRSYANVHLVFRLGAACLFRRMRERGRRRKIHRMEVGMANTLMDFSNSLADAVELAGRSIVGVLEGGQHGVSGTQWRAGVR